MRIVPLSPDRWDALANLFGKAGASSGCWCMYWRLGNGYYRRPHEQNREDFRTVVAAGPPPGLLAYKGELAVGWCQLTPRDALPWLDRARYLGRVDEAAVWSISCFFVRRGYRGQGVASELILAAVDAARAAHVDLLEAYPIDASVPGASRNNFTGSAAAFRRAGFEVVLARTPSRPIMRYDLRAESATRGGDSPLTGRRESPPQTE